MQNFVTFHNHHLANLVSVVQQVVQATPLAKKNVPPPPPVVVNPTVVAPLATIILSELSGTQNSLPFQELSTSRTAGTTALMPKLITAAISTIDVVLNYGNEISGMFTIPNISALTPAILQAGLYVQVDVVSAANVANFYLTNLIPISPSYNRSATNTLFVSLVDTNNNVYAAGAINLSTGDAAVSYQVTLNNGRKSQIVSAAVPLTSATPSAIFVQQSATARLAPSSKDVNLTVISSPLPTMTTFQVFGGAPNTVPFLKLSTSRTSGTTALMPTSNAAIATIGVNFDYGNEISGYFILANIPKLIPAVLQAGLYVQVDIVPAANVANFYLTKLIPVSYFYTQKAVNTLFVSLIDANNNVYAAGAVSLTSDRETGNAASYSVVLNNGLASQVTSAAVPLTSDTPPAIFVQQVAATSPTSPLILPAQNIGYVLGGTPVQGTFTSISSSTSNVFNKTPYSTKSGQLKSLQVGVTDAKASCFLIFDFDNLIMQEPAMQALAAQGLYVGIVCATTSSGNNTVTVQLTNLSGTVYATGTYTLDPGVGALSQYYVSFNATINQITGGFTLPATKQYAVRVPLAQTVYYKQAS
ncbi:hypothetical protein A3J41_00965 [candidate division TM6 bacterium RIFCSPHIGHO2_12_FULL_38_8]|nr:MAG: hypothetical protein A3J41_00965 [candidate division TM6 bacterium RIFCSPHIGHO2_12_FULL_38_8]